VSETAEQIDDGIDVMDMTDEEFEAYVGEMDEKLKDNYDNDGDEAEYDALLEKRSAARNQYGEAKKEHNTRQESNRHDLKKLAAEAVLLEGKLAEGVSPDDEADLRAPNGGGARPARSS
jgi:hypothetical protein